MDVSSTTVALVVVLVVLLLFLIGGCTLSCGSKEGYKHTSIGSECGFHTRTPVDFAFKYPNGWQRNPHYQAYPGINYQPLEYGPVDLYRYSREMNKDGTLLFRQYRNDWRGLGNPGDVPIINDEKTRFDFGDVGDTGARRELENVHHERHGPRDVSSHIEANYIEKDPYPETHRLYGGYDYHVNNRLGD